MTAMVETTMDTDPMGARPPETGTEQASTKQPDLFERAIHHPANAFTPVTSREIQMARQRGGEQASAHLLASVLLRLTKDGTTIEDYTNFERAAASHEELRKSERPKASKEALEASAINLDSARKKAAPYAGMLVAARSASVEYRQAYEKSGESMAERREFLGKLYEQTGGVEHPGVVYIHGLVNEARDLAIESERVLRHIISTGYDPAA